MKATFLSLVFAASVLAQGQLTINTPANAVECQPLLLTWSGGEAPYFVFLIRIPVNHPCCNNNRASTSVLPGATPGGQALVDFGQQNGTSVTWLVNQQANTPLGLTLRDNTGQVAQSASFTVNPGSSSACLTQTLSFSGGTAVAPSPTGGAAPPAATPTPNPTAPGSSAAATGSSRATGASAAATSARPSTTNAASANFAGASAAGVIGVILAAFFA